MLVVMAGWVFFRAGGLTQALAMLPGPVRIWPGRSPPLSPGALRVACGPPDSSQSRPLPRMPLLAVAGRLRTSAWRRISRSGSGRCCWEAGRATSERAGTRALRLVVDLRRGPELQPIHLLSVLTIMATDASTTCRRIADSILIVGFLGLLVVPTLGLVRPARRSLGPRSGRWSVASLTLLLRHPKIFLKQFGQSFSDHFFLREDLVQLHARVAYYGFNQSSSRRVILGTTPWLFLQRRPRGGQALRPRGRARSVSQGSSAHQSPTREDPPPSRVVPALGRRSGCPPLPLLDPTEQEHHLSGVHAQGLQSAMRSLANGSGGGPTSRLDDDRGRRFRAALGQRGGCEASTTGLIPLDPSRSAMLATLRSCRSWFAGSPSSSDPRTVHSV